MIRKFVARDNWAEEIVSQWRGRPFSATFFGKIDKIHKILKIPDLRLEGVKTQL
jgi:hypothetical protein